MTTTATRPQANPVDLAKPRLPQWAPILVGVGSVALALLIGLLLSWGFAAIAVVAVVLYIALLPTWSLVVENRRAAVDRLMTWLVWLAFAIALVPLVSLIWTVVAKGTGAISSTFLTYSMFRTDLDQPVGIYHALVGTLLITLFAALISVPIGIFAAIYLIEYGKGNRLARGITFLVDVMTGIPSIVAGLFAFSLWILIFGPSRARRASAGRSRWPC